MSLINDALKRARTTPAPAPASSADAAMIPVAAPVTRVPKTSRTPVGLIAGMVVCAGVAGWFFFKWREASTTSQPTGESTALASIEKSQPFAAKPAPLPAAPSVSQPAILEPVVVPAQPKPAVTAAVAPPAATPAIQPAAVSAPAPAPVVAANTAPLPELKLQAIVFRMKNPSALINGRHVEVGDDVSGVRIAEIQRTTVFIEWQGQKLPLRLN